MSNDTDETLAVWVRRALVDGGHMEGPSTIGRAEALDGAVADIIATFTKWTLRGTEYVYLPNDESEYGPIWSTSEALSEITDARDWEDAKEATLVVMREGSRGHYLAATFIDDAADLVENAHKQGSLAGVLTAETPDERREQYDEIIRQADVWRKAAESYNAHGGGPCPPESNPSEDTRLCQDCEFIHDDADKAEQVLSDLGYVMTWNDGFTIHKVESE